VQLTVPAPQAARRLLAVCPDVAELLALMTLHKSILYASTPIAMWQRLVGLKISWDFAVLGKVIRKRERFMVFDPSGGDRRVAVISLTLITSNLRLASLSDMYPVGVFCGRWRITAFIGFSDFGKNE
jgi:hypothetical protein